MNTEKAEFEQLLPGLQVLGEYLDEFLKFKHTDALRQPSQWEQLINQAMPEQGVGLQQMINELGGTLVPAGSAIPRPGCTAFITTGATSAGTLATLAGAVASPQRVGLNAFSRLEEISLQWLADLFELGNDMKGIYSSGGSVANLVALGGARQWAFEQLGIDPSASGVNKPCRIYATHASHHTIHRAAAVLGLGRNCVSTIASDDMGRMIPAALEKQIVDDNANDKKISVAVVANAGITATGAIDPLLEIGDIARKHAIWFHVDGAYGLPGILDPRVRDLYKGIETADSVIVDPHKWLGAPVGIGATFVRDRSILYRAFTQGPSDYLEGTFIDEGARHSLDSMGIPYHDFGVELSAPSRGVVVWALLREIGRAGLSQRICRHNNMARDLANKVNNHPRLELLQQPTLSICCFRYIDDGCNNLNELNAEIYRQLVYNNRNIPSTAMLDGKLAIRPCFVGARTNEQHAVDLFEEVISIGDKLAPDFRAV